jgi:hypothetical protein
LEDETAVDEMFEELQPNEDGIKVFAIVEDEVID